MEYNKKGPFIHLFQTPLGYYFYDVNTNQIIKINNDIYTILQNYTEECKNNEQILKLYEAGLLKTNRVQKIKHPYTELLPYALKRKVHILILQITQNCNLRCEYCLYSGGYKTRKHQNKRMNWITAKEAIDSLKAHSNEKKKVYIAFYGGEPLLEFELIRKCVHYAQSIMPGKEIEYSMTTNGTLLNKEVIEYLVKNNFKITVSIDGPKEVHDRSRHFADTDKGSFDVILENLRYFREKHLKFYEKNVGFNSVVSTEYNFSCSDDFFKEEELFKDSIFALSGISESFSKNKNVVSSQYMEEEQYELFKLFLSFFSRVNQENVSVLLREYVRHLIGFEQKMKDGVRNELPEIWHRSGPCIPGVVRLFVNAYGDFFPCEKVSELAQICKIGNLKEGFNIEKIENILNIEKETQKECQDCWAYSECTSCVRFCDDCADKNTENILSNCKKIRSSVDETFKDYTVLKELGASLFRKDAETILNSDEKIEITVPIIAIGNLLIGMEKEGEQVAEKVKRQMECMGYRVGILNGNDLINKALSIPKNIIEINKSIKRYELEEKLDLIIMIIPGNIAEISDRLYGDGGAYLYILSQSIAIDGLIVNVPYSEYYFNERQNIKSEIERSGGIKVYLNIVPKYLDIAVSEEENEVDFLTLSSDFVKNKIDMYHAEDVYCVNDFTSLNDLIIELIEELASYVEDVKCEDLKTFNMDIKDVEKCISDIFEKIGLTKDLIQKAKQESIFGNKIRMRARELLIVFFEIERVFNIYFTEEEINDFSFASINSIIECVKKHLKNKSDVINK